MHLVYFKTNLEKDVRKIRKNIAGLSQPSGLGELPAFTA